MPVSAKKIGVFTEHMVRLISPKIILFVKGNVLVIGFIDRPVSRFPFVSDIVGTRVDEFQVAFRLKAGIHPVIIRLLSLTWGYARKSL